MTKAQLIRISVPSIDSTSDLAIIRIDQRSDVPQLLSFDTPVFSGLCFSLAGDSQINIDETPLKLKKRCYQFLCIPAASARVTLLPGNHKLLFIQLPPDFIALFRDSLLQELDNVLSAIDRQELYTSFTDPRRIPYDMLTTITEIIRFKASEDLLHAFYYNKIVSLLFQHIQNMLQKGRTLAHSKPGSEEIVMAEHLLKKEYRKNWTLDLLSASVGVHRRKLTDLFRQILGTSPMEYLNDLRLQKAFDLLKTTSLSVTDITRKIGYGHIQSFSRAFHRKYHVSPQQCRKYTASNDIHKMLP